jgi:trans-aconitate 2-methyltransferase
MATWDPASYLKFTDERSRPYFDLVDRVGATAPVRVVDLGCGPGQLTAALAQRWPDAEIIGIDSSPEMIDAAQQHAGPRVRFEVGDIATWRIEGPVDVIVSNAALQWVPTHRKLLPQLVDALGDGGWLAFQVPGNFGEPSHQLLRDLARFPRYADATRRIEFPHSFDAETYLGDLVALGCEVDAWETTYLHLLEGEDPVFEWISGTGARPVLQALEGQSLEAFTLEYKEQLRRAYPAHAYGTVLPFRRIFCVASKRVR